MASVQTSIAMRCPPTATLGERWHRLRSLVTGWMTLVILAFTLTLSLVHNPGEEEAAILTLPGTVGADEAAETPPGAEEAAA